MYSKLLLLINVFFHRAGLTFYFMEWTKDCNGGVNVGGLNKPY